jgi:WD40 repeat protein
MVMKLLGIVIATILLNCRLFLPAQAGLQLLPPLLPITTQNAHQIVEVQKLEGHIDDVEKVAFDPTGKVLASAGWDGVRVWDLVQGTEIAYLNPPESGTNIFTEVAFSPDGRVLAAVAFDTIWIWEAGTFEEITALVGHEGSVSAISFSPDSLRLISGGVDTSIFVWNTNNWTQLARLQGHQEPISALSFSADGNYFVSASDDPYIDTGNSSITLWNAKTFTQVDKFSISPSTPTTSAVFHPTENILALGSLDENDLTIWDVDTQTQLGDFKAVPYAITFSPDGNLLIVMDYSGIVIFDFVNGRELLTLQGHEAHVTDVAVNSTGILIATSSWDNTIILWGIPEG